MMTLDRVAFDMSMRRLLDAIERAGKKSVPDGVKAAWTSAERTTLYRDRTGKTRRSLIGTWDDYKGKLRSGGATRWIENGTPPHEIAARRAPTLKFQVNGQWRSPKSVQHRGTTARPFMAEASRVGERALEFSLEVNTNDAIGRH